MQSKIKTFIVGLLFGLTFVACNDTLDSIGMGMQPDSDKIGVYTDTLTLDAVTVQLDSIYAKSISGYLGKLYDPLYGEIQSGYICQFYAPTSGIYAFRDTAINNVIDSVYLRISYDTSIGDTLTPMEVSTYPVVKALDKNYYTNIDPAKYCDMNSVWGKQGYTARNLNVPDDEYYDQTSYQRGVSIKLPAAFGQKLYDEFKKPAPNAYSSLEAFVKFFPGLYLKSTFGSGNILSVLNTDIFVFYSTMYTGKDAQGKDSTYNGDARAQFPVTKEIIQLNSFRNTHDSQLLVPDNEKTYIKTPAGVFTKVIIPVPEIVKRLGKKKFTNAKFALTTYGQPDWKFPLAPPQKVLLINPDSVKTFFEDQKVADRLTTFTSTLSGYTFDFRNIASVIQNAIDKAPDKNLELLVIPIETKQTIVNQTYVDYSTSHYLAPSGVTIRKGKEYMKLEIVATDIDIDQLKK